MYFFSEKPKIWTFWEILVAFYDKFGDKKISNSESGLPRQLASRTLKNFRVEWMAFPQNYKKWRKANYNMLSLFIIRIFTKFCYGSNQQA